MLQVAAGISLSRELHVCLETPFGLARVVDNANAELGTALRSPKCSASVVCVVDLSRCEGLNPSLVSCVVGGFVLVCQMIVMLCV